MNIDQPHVDRLMMVGTLLDSPIIYRNVCSCVKASTQLTDGEFIGFHLGA